MKHFGKSSDAIRLAAVEFSEINVAGAQVNDLARRNQLDSDSRVAAHYGAAAEDRGERGLVLDTVLKRENRAAGIEASSDGIRGRVGIVSLHAEQDEVVRREVARCVGRLNLDPQVAANAGDVEAALANRAQIFAARAQHDVLARRPQPRAEEAPTAPAPITSIFIPPIVAPTQSVVINSGSGISERKQSSKRARTAVRSIPGSRDAYAVANSRRAIAGNRGAAFARDGLFSNRWIHAWCRSRDCRSNRRLHRGTGGTIVRRADRRSRAVAGIGKSRSRGHGRGAAPRDAPASTGLTRIGPVGAVATVIGFALEIWCLSRIVDDAGRAGAIVMAMMLSRWAIIPIGYGLKPLEHWGLGIPYAGGISFREFAVSSVVALGLTMGLYQNVGLAVIIVLALTILAMRLVLSRRMGGASGYMLAGVRAGRSGHVRDAGGNSRIALRGLFKIPRRVTYFSHGYWKSWNLVFSRRDDCAGQRRVRQDGRENGYKALWIPRPLAASR